MTNIENLRQWVIAFNAGKFENSSLQNQVFAGWYDWFCRGDVLHKKTKSIGSKLRKIESDFILDNFYILIKNCKPLTGKSYDMVKFLPASKEANNLGFQLTFESDTGRFRYKLFFDSIRVKDYMCNSSKEAITYINNIGEQFNPLIKNSPTS